MKIGPESIKTNIADKSKLENTNHILECKKLLNEKKKIGIYLLQVIYLAVTYRSKYMQAL